ncbi:MAG: EF-hand domain-containing protein [Candidatus Nitrotoga sp.]|nr:EF-hand domain-containing protein [Candidatus Nitrotoga sp.]
MKKTIISLAIFSGLTFGITSAYAVKDPAGWQREGQKTVEMKQDKSFDDMSNSVTNAEYKAYFDKRFEELGKKNDGRVSHEQVLFVDFSLADSNRDGALSEEEGATVPLIKEHFDAIDANNDDKVTGDELIEFMATWRKNHEGKMLH